MNLSPQSISQSEFTLQWSTRLSKFFTQVWVGHQQQHCEKIDCWTEIKSFFTKEISASIAKASTRINETMNKTFNERKPKEKSWAINGNILMNVLWITLTEANITSGMIFTKLIMEVTKILILQYTSLHQGSTYASLCSLAIFMRKKAALKTRRYTVRMTAKKLRFLGECCEAWKFQIFGCQSGLVVWNGGDLLQPNFIISYHFKQFI